MPERRQRGAAKRDKSDERSRPREQSDEKSKPQLSARAIGPAIVLLLLAGYFLWMTVEMGTAAVSGATPMFAFLAAAAIGVAAAGIALAVGRRR